MRLPISIAFFTHSPAVTLAPHPPPPSSPRRVTLCLPTSLPYQIIFKPNLSLFSSSLCFLFSVPSLLPPPFSHDTVLPIASPSPWCSHLLKLLVSVAPPIRPSQAEPALTLKVTRRHLLLSQPKATQTHSHNHTCLLSITLDHQRQEKVQHCNLLTFRSLRRLEFPIFSLYDHLL